MKGKLYVIDGIDGCGKSTIAELVGKYLGTNITVIEPFSNRELIDELDFVASTMNKSKEEVFSEKLINIAWLMDLFINTKRHIVALLEEGKNVFLVRYVLSAKVYSLATTKADISELFEIYNLLPVPDLGFFINIDSSIAESRIIKRNEQRTYYENKEYLDRIHEKYTEFLSRERYPIVELNGEKSQLELLNCILSYIK